MAEIVQGASKLWTRPIQFINLDNSTSRLMGGGTNADPLTISEADKNFLDFRTKNTATSGTSRGIYFRHFIAGAGQEGEAARFATVVNGVAATGGVHGAHIAAVLDATGTSSGLMAGVRATLEVETATRSLSGTFAALQVDSFIGTGNTMPAASTSFIRVADSGAVAVSALFNIPASTVARKGSAASSSDGLAIILDGVTKYLMVGT